MGMKGFSMSLRIVMLLVMGVVAAVIVVGLLSNGVGSAGNVVNMTEGGLL